MVATYEEVKELPNHPQKYLIDVRNADELSKTGVIPTSVNIPLPELDDALKLSDEQFKLKYKRDKPSENAEVIFHCLAGGRARRAADLAISNGYKNSKCYAGSWKEWAAKEGL